MTRSVRKNAKILAMAAVLILACAPTFSPTLAPIPTFDPGSLDRMIFETANAASTQTQAHITPTLTLANTLTPTGTPTSTDTPTPKPSATNTPTPTNTFVYLLFTPTPSKTEKPTQTKTPREDDGGGGGGGGGKSEGYYACTLISQTPRNDTRYAPGTPFWARWFVKNIGDPWDHGSVDYRYAGGTAMHEKYLYDMQRDVGTGKAVNISVLMRAPAIRGVYSAVWVMVRGKTTFCPLAIRIVVR